MKALDDIFVLDLSRILAGPWATQILGDLGADVVKVERPGRGDDTRGWGPPFLTDPETGAPGDASYYLCANRNKRSIALDISTPEGQETIRALAAKAGVLVENYKVGGLKKYGLDYESLSKVNPGLVYCSITGFGQEGPLAGKAGYDFMIQAMGGMMSINGECDGLPGAGPQKVGIAMADLSTGLYATIAILAALHQRQRSGKGQYIDMALLDTQVAMLSNHATSYFISGKVPTRLGNGHATIVPYQSFPTEDGYLVIAVGNDGQFARLAAELGHPEWGSDARYSTNAARVGHRQELIPMIEAETRKRKSAELQAALESCVVPCGQINTVDQVFEEPQVKLRGLRQTVAHPHAGELSIGASPLRLSDSPITYDRPPPLVGQHTEEVLAEKLGR
ncbi:CaiB/BaiF CoA-transferase family protein [Paracoccus sp. (in: a-proteobacteria)]|uniref:CaiB/BaiF CoA transferase family protein n=1 Tax=Paracoccus sp. TaxID=267 RepID=UPI003341700C